MPSLQFKFLEVMQKEYIQSLPVHRSTKDEPISKNKSSVLREKGLEVENT